MGAVTPPGLLPTDQYIASLARKRMAAGVLFRDPDDRILLVEPSYKPSWDIPGGVVEDNESPWRAATRELAEELDWHRPFGRLLVVDYVHRDDTDAVVFVFDGGIMTETEVDSLTFPDGEILSAAFHTIPEARARTTPLLGDRLASALDATGHPTTVLCEQGQGLRANR
ncbi:MAG TPA: NUDIX hydrolase [Pseudonocardiaceae bacterium]|jgi:ADP-ribose pyrophosphatase YjhB (NUDIX family)|nr:NUDIX hydrolase [Pseudonocardiaceae bacterium]